MLLKIALLRVTSQEPKKVISAAQIRAARALLNLNQQELARIASVHVATIRRLEAATSVRGAADTLWKLQHALESKGVEFLPEDAGRGFGVRLKQPSQRQLDR
jgi:transcriptional regulator with XRE-family HTH domain